MHDIPFLHIRTCLQRHVKSFISFPYPRAYALLGSQDKTIKNFPTKLGEEAPSFRKKKKKKNDIERYRSLSTRRL